MAPEEKLKYLGLELPQVPAPIGNFLPWRRVGNLLYLSGQGPRDEFGAIKVGKVGKDCSVDNAYDDARRVGLQILASIRQALGSLDRVEAVVKLFGMVNAVSTFTEHPKVIKWVLRSVHRSFGQEGLSCSIGCRDGLIT